MLLDEMCDLLHSTHLLPFVNRLALSETPCLSAIQMYHRHVIPQTTEIRFTSLHNIFLVTLPGLHFRVNRRTANAYIQACTSCPSNIQFSIMSILRGTPSTHLLRVTSHNTFLALKNTQRLLSYAASALVESVV